MFKRTLESTENTIGSNWNCFQGTKCCDDLMTSSLTSLDLNAHPENDLENS